ncbi:MAG: fructose PTS transporter subunit IIA [Erysipelotrichaceae bacterium]|nr:fructose PTS transporter subunit IIA [Erysipelotrichaceae bacterium]
MFDKKLVIFSDKEYKSKFDVIKELSQLVSFKVTNPEDYFNSVKEREDTLATYIEYGVAIPHAKTNAVKEPFVVYEKLANGVEWGNNGELANYIFMIGVPEEFAGNLHLKIISELSKNLIREEFRNKLLNAENSNEVYELLMVIEKEILK